MKKNIFFLVFIVLTHGVAAHEQLYHYTYDYTITRDGTTEVNQYPAYSREYSLSVWNRDFFFCLPDGRTLPGGWLHGSDDGIVRTTFSSDNVGRYQSTEYIDDGKIKGEYDCYLVNRHSVTCIPDLEPMILDSTATIWLSKNRKQLVFPSEYATLVFKRIPKRTITQHVPMCPVIKNQPINRPL